MTTKEIAAILQEDRVKITNIIRQNKLPIKRLKTGYWFKESDIEIVRKEVERMKIRKQDKASFLKLFWSEIKDDNKRNEVVRNYALKFDITENLARIQINDYFISEVKRIHEMNKPRIETREDGTIVHVYQSRINYENH